MSFQNDSFSGKRTIYLGPKWRRNGDQKLPKSLKEEQENFNGHNRDNGSLFWTGVNDSGCTVKYFTNAKHLNSCPVLK